MTGLAATLFALLFAGGICQSTAPAGWHGSSIIGTGPNGTNESLGFVYPDTGQVFNVHDVVILDWWTNATNAQAEIALPAPNDPQGTITASVSTIATTAYTFGTYASYPHNVSFGFAITRDGGVFGNMIQAQVTSTSGAASTYAAMTTGASVSLTTATSTGAAAGPTGGVGMAGVVGAAAAAVAVLL